MLDNSENNAQHKVLVVSHYYAAHGGGIERVIGQLIPEISRSDNFHFTWVASDIDALPVPSGRADHPNQTLPMGTNNFTEKWPGIPWPIWGWNSLLKLRTAIAASDIIWLHDTLYMGNIAAFLWAKQLGKPVLITQHIGPIPYKNPILRLVMYWADRLITCRLLQEAGQATFISDQIAEDYYRRISFTKPVRIIPNGVDLRHFYLALLEKRNWLRNQFALRGDQPVLLFVGRLVEKKGINVIRHLAELMPHCRFWLAGRGTIKPESWHLPNIHLFSDRQGASLAELYHAADCLILPSYGEGFPLVIQEALACGLPVLCSPETAAGSKIAAPYLHTAPVLPGNAKETAALWARRIADLLRYQSPDFSPDNLAEFAATTWSWPNLANAYADIFRALLRSKTNR